MTGALTAEPTAAARAARQALVAAIQPGLRGERPGAGLTLPLRAGLVVWDPSAPVTGAPLAALPAPGFRRTLGELIPEVQSGPVFSSPTLAVPGAPAPAHAVGTPKGEAALTFGPGDERALGSVATWLSVSDELVEDVDGLAAWIDAYLEWLVRLGEEHELLTGDGTASHVLGFMAHPAIPVYAGGATSVPARVAGMVAQVAAGHGGFVPDTVALSPADWAECLVDGTADADFGGRLFGCDVVPTQALADGETLVGACQQAAVIGRTGTLKVEGTRSHDVNFVADVSAVRATSRLQLGVLVPLAFVRSAA